MKNKQKVIIGLVMLLLTVSFSIIGSFSFFSAINNKQGSGNTSVKAAKLAMNLEGCQTLDLIDIVPGASKSCTFTVTNTGTKYLIYDYQLSDVYNELSRTEDLVYTVTKNGELKVNKNFPISGSELISTDNCLGPLDTDTYVVTITYLDKDTDQSEDMNKKATANIEVTNIDYADECIIRSYTVKIDPTPGMYKGSKEASLYTASLGDEISIEDATSGTKTAYTFAGWNASDGKTYTNLLTVRGNVTLAAKWDVNPDAVSRIDDVYYMTLEEANANAKDGDTITMIKNDTENVVFDKDVTLDLNGFNINGTITNTRDLIINGAGIIKSTEDAIINTGTLTIGENDGIVSVDAPYIEGAGNGINNQGEFNFYDGMIVGLEANSGYYDLIPDGYYVFVNHDDNTNIQKAWLVSEVDTRAICRINKVLFMNLNDAISSRDLSKIIFIRDAELAYDITIPEGHTRTIDIAGYTINSGYSVINNGNLTLTDTGLEAGIWNNSVHFTNNSIMTFKNVKTQSTTNYNGVNNYGTLNLVNSVISGNTSYGVEANKGIINIDKDSDIRSISGYGVNVTGATEIDGNGYVDGIVHHTTAKFTLKNINLYSDKTDMYCLLVASKGEVVIESGKIEPRVAVSAVALSEYDAKLTMNGGLITSDLAITGIEIQRNGISVTINNGTIDLPNIASRAIYNIDSKLHIKDLTANAGTFIYASYGNIIIDDAEVYCSNTNAWCVNLQSRGTATINNINLQSDGSGFYSTESHVVINGGTINAIGSAFCRTGSYYYNGYTVYDFYLIINDGYFHSENGYGLEIADDGRAYIYGGKFISDNTYGGYVHITNSYNNRGFYLGRNDDNIDLEKIAFTGKTYGLYITDQTPVQEIYDGIFKGQTDGFKGKPTQIPSGTIMGNLPEEEINNEIYQVSSLISRENFLRVGDKEYNSFSKAISAANNDLSHTITLIKDQSIAEIITVNKTDDVIFDLNGYTLDISNSLRSYGHLVIKDSSEEETGVLRTTSSYNVIAYNGGGSGKLVIENGNFVGGTSALIYTEASDSDKIIINGGNFVGSNYSLYLVNGDVTINGGNYNTTNNSVPTVWVKAILKINGGTFDNPSYYNHTIESHGIVDINDGTIKNSSGGGAVKQHYNNARGGNRLYVNGGELIVSSSNVCAVEAYHAPAYIYGGSIRNKNGIAACNTGRSILNIYGGNILSDTSYAVSNKDWGSITVAGGHIESLRSAAVFNQMAVMNIGIKDGVVNNDNFEMIGATYGIYNNYGEFYYYDGIAKGVTAGIFGTPNQLEVGCLKTNHSEVINDITYDVVSLVQLDNFIRNGEIYYNTLQSAFNSCPTDGTECNLVLENTATIGEVASIVSGQNILIDLNGNNLSNTMQITINGNLKMFNSSDQESSASFYSLHGGLINNGSGNLVLENIAIYSHSSQADTGNTNIIQNNSSGKLYINDCTIYKTFTGGYAPIFIGSGVGYLNNITTNVNGVVQLGRGATLNINDGVYGSEGNTETILDLSYGTINISDVTVNGVIHTYQSTLNITSGDFNGYSTNALYIYTATLNINGGHFYNNSSQPLIKCTESYSTINDGELINSGTGTVISETTKSTINVNGGMLRSVGGYAVYSGATINVGKNDGIVDNNQPIIIGKTYGVYADGLFYYYDGILKGMTNGSNKISAMPDNYDVFIDSEIIDDNEYIVNYLISAMPFLKNGDNEYSNLQIAIDEASNGDVIEFINNGSTYYNVIIPQDKNITIDLKGYNLMFNLPFINKGELHLISSGEKSIVKYTVYDYLLNNNGIMFVDNLKLESYMMVNNSGSNLEINNSVLESSGYFAYSSIGNMSISDSIVTCNDDCISSYGMLKIDGSTISSNDILLDQGKNNLSISDSTLKGSLYFTGYYFPEAKFDNVVLDASGATRSSIDNHIGTNLVFNNMTISTPASNRSQAIDSSGKISGTKLVVNVLRSDYLAPVITTSNVLDIGELNISSSYDLSGNSSAIQLSSVSNSSIDKLIISGGFTHGLYQSGSGNITINSAEIDMNSNRNTTMYGIYNNGTGKISVLDGHINMLNTGTGNVYGLYNNSTGAIVLGSRDGNYNIDNPSVYAKAVNGTGVGVKKVNGYFEYYDGKITGSTSAKPETTSLVEPGYEVAFYQDENDYNYCILEYMEG